MECSETYYNLLGGDERHRIPEIFGIDDLISLSTVPAGEVDESKLRGWKKRILTMKLERASANKTHGSKNKRHRRRKSSLQMAEDEVRPPRRAVAWISVIQGGNGEEDEDAIEHEYGKHINSLVHHLPSSII